MQKIFSNRKEYDLTMSKKIFGQEDCPFCDTESNMNRIIWKGKYWYIIRNLYPYSGDSWHVMAVPYEHKRYSYELNQDELLELKDVHNYLKDFYQERSYFSCTRESMANRSVEHLHIHFLPGKLQGKFLRKMLESQGFPIQEDLSIDS